MVAHGGQQALSSQALLGQIALAAAAGNPNFAANFGVDVSGFGMQGSQAAAGGVAAAGQQARSATGAQQYHW